MHSVRLLPGGPRTRPRPWPVRGEDAPSESQAAGIAVLVGLPQQLVHTDNEEFGRGYTLESTSPACAEAVPVDERAIKEPQETASDEN